MTFPIPDAVLASHIAVLGKTGAGKTSTSKTIVEHLVGQDARVCVLDPIKSDWWGLTSSADGKRAGLPFHILGGPRGHVPLHATSGRAIAEIVASSALPLSILDMALFEPGGQSKFFVHFAPTLLRKMRGVLHLVIEEAHMFAPKERSGIGDENMAIHWAKMLATAGRSRGIRLIVATQRTQALHNAVLGSCDTMIAHRLTAPADQKPVNDWLKANVANEVQKAVSESLSSLKTGTAWVCSGEARFFEMVAFPPIATYDNTATPTGDLGEAVVRTAPVDVDKLRAIVGDAAKEAEANDPRALKAEIAKLKAELAKKPATVASAPDPGVVEAARQAAYHEGWITGVEEGEKRGQVSGQALMLTRVRNALDGLRVEPAQDSGPPVRAPVAQAPAPVRREIAPTVAAKPNGHDQPALTGPQSRIIDALAWWSAFGIEQPTNEQVGFVAGYAPGSGNFNNLKGGMRAAGLIEYPAGGRITLTEAGRTEAREIALEVSQDAFHAQVRAKLNGPQVRLLDPAIAAYPDSISTEEIAAAAGYAAGSGNFNNLRGSLRTIGLIDYPSPGFVRAADWLFP